MRAISVIFDCPEYVLVTDQRLPNELKPKENIILKPAGLKILADHYFQKYGVIICVIEEFVKINALAQKITDSLSEAKKNYPAARQIGFIFISNDEAIDQFGHALPMIWEKENNGQEHLFFLDTCQYLGATEQRYLKPGVPEFRQTLLALNPHLKLWGLCGRRQIDYSSCYTDALVILKDGLRQPSFKILAEKKIKETAPGLLIFYAPALLLKTAQIDSYVTTAEPVLDDFLKQRREKYNLLVKDSNNGSKLFGTFTLFKAQKQVQKIEAKRLVENVVENALKSSFVA